MSNTNNFVFLVVKIVSWIIFVGLCIEAGALIVNFVFSLFKPEVVHNLYQKLDLSEMYARSTWTFYNIYSFLLVISILKAVLFYVVINLTLKINLTKPFLRCKCYQHCKLSFAKAFCDVNLIISAGSI